MKRLERFTWELWSEEDSSGRQCVTANVDVEIVGSVIKVLSYDIDWSDSEFCFEPLVRWVNGCRLIENEYSRTPFAPLIDSFQDPNDIQIPEEVLQNHLEFLQAEEDHGIRTFLAEVLR